MREILENIVETVSQNRNERLVDDDALGAKVEAICRCERNRAPVRFLIAGLLAKIKDPSVDLHKPYITLGDHSFRGRSIDEDVVGPFLHSYQLPCNHTTAFLTPAFRTIEAPLTKEQFNKCRPKDVYFEMCDVIECVEADSDIAFNTLSEMIRMLFVIKNETEQRMTQLKQALSEDKSSLQLSSEEVTKLLIQHLSCRGSSRLPVLIITAAYEAVADLTRERTKPLFAHNAADSQTGALGDVEIVLQDEDRVVTCYEMKKKKVTIEDVKICVDKIVNSEKKIDNYILITTQPIEEEVVNYAATFYNEIGIEFVVLDCIGFIKHYLHFFHRYRILFINKYQELVLNEPDSSVSQPLKEAFLTLRRVAELGKEL